MRNTSKIKKAVIGLVLGLGLGGRAYGEGLDYTQMSLEELMNVPVTTITLTSTDRYLTPAAVTHIDRAQIDQANSRSLNDLLGVYVPDMQTAYHTFEARHLGMRGIIGDREDKYLMLVNGRDMNERTHYGALTERDLILNGDIEEIDVVRGPGSATYGPGAVMGVISQKTFSGLTFQGSDVKIRQGFFDQYSSAEFKYGKKFDENTGFFVYGGIADIQGANKDYAPMRQGWEYDSPIYGHVGAGDDIPNGDLHNFGDSYEDSPHAKLHMQYDSGGFTAWARYTHGGLTMDPDKTFIPGSFNRPTDAAVSEPGVGYQQLTLFLGYKFDITKDLKLDLSTSWDATDYERVYFNAMQNSHQEQKWISKAVLSWSGLENHKMALGMEYGYFSLGLHSWMSPNAELSDNQNPWMTDMISVFYEDQWKISKEWTLFSSVRFDQHKYTELLASPRVALVWAPTDKDVLKLIAAQSLRTNTEEGMRSDWMNGDQRSDPEKMRSYELRYERQQTESLSLASSLFFNKLDVLGWSNDAQKMVLAGMYKTAGIELELNYRTKTDAFTLSHSYAKLVGQDIEGNSFITSAAYGNGYDLNSWSNQVTKLTAHHQFNDKFSMDGSLQVMWGYPGSKDYMEWKNPGMISGIFKTGNATNPGDWDEPFGISAMMNLGMQYKLDKHATIRLDAYNVLGWFDDTLNKNMMLGSLWDGTYRVQPPAIGISFEYSF